MLPMSGVVKDSRTNSQLHLDNHVAKIPSMSGLEQRIPLSRRNPVFRDQAPIQVGNGAGGHMRHELRCEGRFSVGIFERERTTPQVCAANCPHSQGQ